MLESPLFEQVKSERPAPKLPLLAVLRTHRRNVLLTVGARFAANAFFSFFTVWVLTYATQQPGRERGPVLNGVLLGSAAQLVAIPCVGALSDRVGRRPVYLGGAIFLLTLAFPFFGLQLRSSRGDLDIPTLRTADFGFRCVAAPISRPSPVPPGGR